MTDPAPPMPSQPLQTGDIQAGEVNIAGGHVIQVEAGGTLIMGGGQIGAGIQLLNTLVQANGRLLAVVATFANDFQSACVQVDILADYKELHDLLHQIQFHCYEPISLEMSRFPEESSLDAIDSYRHNLSDILTQLSSVTSKQRLPEADTGFLQDLDACQQELCQATQLVDAALLKKAVWRMRRLLTTQPVRINTRLIDSARALRLEKLLVALEQIYEHVKELELRPEQTLLFQNGVAALAQLSLALGVLLQMHDAWQMVDMELRRIEASTEQDLVELEMSWPDLKQRSGYLFADTTNPSLVNLQTASSNLDEALKTGLPGTGAAIKTRRAFRAFRREAGSRFFQIDVNLHRLCEELRLIGEPLNTLLKSV